MTPMSPMTALLLGIAGLAVGVLLILLVDLAVWLWRRR